MRNPFRLNYDRDEELIEAINPELDDLAAMARIDLTPDELKAAAAALDQHQMQAVRAGRTPANVQAYYRSQTLLGVVNEIKQYGNDEGVTGYIDENGKWRKY